MVKPWWCANLHARVPRTLLQAQTAPLLAPSCLGPHLRRSTASPPPRPRPRSGRGNKRGRDGGEAEGGQPVRAGRAPAAPGLCGCALWWWDGRACRADEQVSAVGGQWVGLIILFWLLWTGLDLRWAAIRDDGALPRAQRVGVGRQGGCGQKGAWLGGMGAALHTFTRSGLRGGSRLVRAACVLRLPLQEQARLLVPGILRAAGVHSLRCLDKLLPTPCNLTAAHPSLTHPLQP